MKEFKTSPRVMTVDKFGDTDYNKYSVGFGIIDMSTESGDYRPDSTEVPAGNVPNFLFLIPETAGAIVVELLGMNEGETYTITAAQVTAFLGKPLPYKVRRVIKVGTSATFSVVW